MRFSFSDDGPVQGQLIYDDSEKSLRFEFANESLHQLVGVLVVATFLQINFRVDNGRLLAVGGYSPKESWLSKEGDFIEYESKAGSVLVNLGYEAERGTGYATNLEKEPVNYYKNSDHLVIGEAKASFTYVKIAEGIVMGVDRDQLSCVILKPNMT